MQMNERIIQARKQAGMTQEQLGEALGVSRQAVSKWESGQANPDVAYIIKMCELFHLSADWLLLGRELEEEKNASCPEPAFLNQSEPSGEGRYCLYLASTGAEDRKVAKLIEILFQYSWAKPAFPWDGPITKKEAKEIVEMVPLVLCEGLTLEQAETARSVFQDVPAFVSIYRESDMEQREDGTKGRTESAEPLPVEQVERQPLSGGAIFGLVVLGVIVGVLILSIF